jgi:hypothetical protein
MAMRSVSSIEEEIRIMPALVKKLDWPAIAAAGRSGGTPQLGRIARIVAHVVGWPLLVKSGLLSGFALAAAVQHLVAVQP